jgi:hypothetical protein
MTIQELEQRYAALPDVCDVPNTPYLQEETWQRRQTMGRRINVARTASEHIAKLDPVMSELKKQLDVLAGIRERHAQELLNTPKGSRDPFVQARVAALKVGIQMVDGLYPHDECYPTQLPLLTELRAAGYAPLPYGRPLSALYGPLPSIEWRLAELTKQRDAAQRDLDMVLRDV